MDFFLTSFDLRSFRTTSWQPLVPLLFAVRLVKDESLSQSMEIEAMQSSLALIWRNGPTGLELKPHSPVVPPHARSSTISNAA